MNVEEEHIWKILQAYYRTNSVVANQIDSYNDFVNFGMQEIVDQESKIEVSPRKGRKYVVQFGQISLAPPQVIEEDRTLRKLFPSDARLRNLNYDSAIYCDVIESLINDEQEDRKIHYRVMIGRMPVMLQSCVCNLTSQKIKHCECPNDPGGYFIIKGNERVLVAQLRNNYNQVFVLGKKDGDKFKYIAETRSMSTETGHSVLVQVVFGTDNRTLAFSLPCIREIIPVGVVFKALGYTEEEDIINLIGIHIVHARKYIGYILRDSFFCVTQKDALKYIGQYAMHIISKDKESDYAWQVVETELFPHLGISGTIKEQACFLGHMVRKLLYTILGLRKEDDRDNYTNKRVEASGLLLYEIFRNLFKKYISFIRSQLEKRKQSPDILSIISRIKSITKGLHQCIATGNWGIQKNATYIRQGVSQVLDRMTYGATLSHLRRIMIQVGKEGKNVAIRQIHPSQFGFVDPCETPEGQKAGIVLNFAMLARSTKKVPVVVVKKVLDGCKTIITIINMKLCEIKNCSGVFLNNIIIGYSTDAENTVEELMCLRKKKLLDPEISITYDVIDNDIKIFCDEGRFTRPLLTLTNNKLNIILGENYSWNNLINSGLIQYVDASEIENSVIAMSPRMLQLQNNDYCEIHPITMLGIMASTIPWPDHSQSPRNTYQSSMSKQALGIPCLSYNLRTDTVLHVLHYPQRPIITTRISDLIGYNKMPCGINAIVAVACYSGFNQEDSVMLNLSAIQRGLFNLTTYRTIEENEKKIDTYSYEEICMPPKSSEARIKEDHPDYFKRKNANYSLLNSNGIILSRTTHGSVHIKKGDVVVGKILVSGDKSGKKTYMDVSRVIQPGEEGIIDRVHVLITPNGYKLIKIVIRNNRIPTLGDKLASRSAQKGTIGMVYRQEDLPYTASGIVPDIIMNPLALPSRMTINQLIECALGKICIMNGEYGDSTPFTSQSINIADTLMEKYGLQSHGWETMYNGMTGEMLKAKIFIGPTYYQRLKHMVVDKIHSRAKGRITILTRQPLEGRSRDGGLRFGEMERDCMIAHGASHFLKERLFNVSDPFQVPICKKCGIITNTDIECQMCKGDKVVMCNYSYSAKLLHTELTTMGLKLLIRPKE